MMRTLTLALIASTAIVSTLATKHDPLVIWNVSASVPLGLYFVRPIGKLAVADLVIARPPDVLANWLAERRYLALGALLIKRVAALPGQTICRNGRVITIDGVEIAKAQERDHAGRMLPVWNGCLVLLPGQIFLLNQSEPSSLDGRYFGAVSSDRLIGRAAPLWTWEPRQ